jgi:choline kinase
VPVPVVILAAGRGSRLAPLTDELPKCLVRVGVTSPLDSTLAALETAPDVSEIVLVVGHARRRIEAFLSQRRSALAVRSIFNPEYDTRNNIVSAGLAREAGAAGFVLVNSDVVCAPALLHDAVADDDGSFLVVDETRPIRAEAMKVRYTGGRLSAIGKHLDSEAADGEYVGIARFDGAGAAAFFTAVDAILERGGGDQWYEAAIGEAAREVSVGRRPTAGRPWIEIDDPADLARAEREVLPRIWGTL